jgi:hypothetical protein
MNLNRVYTSLLVQQLPYHLFNPNFPENEKYIRQPLPGEWEQAYEKASAILDEARASNRFFHSNGGSIFMDYKDLRDDRVGIGKMDKVAQRFRAEGTLAEIFTTATQVIAEWKTAAKKERER